MINLLMIIYAIAVTSFSHAYLGPSFTGMLIIWFAVGISVKLLKLDNTLKPVLHFIFYFIFLAYPIAESIIKFIIIKNIIHFSWFYLNRIEHFIWIISVGILISPFIVKTQRKLNYIEQLILGFSFLMIIGMCVELLQYCFRAWFYTVSLEKLGIFYKDTVYDSITNGLGAFTVTVFLVIQERVKVGFQVTECHRCHE